MYIMSLWSNLPALLIGVMATLVGSGFVLLAMVLWDVLKRLEKCERLLRMR